VAPTGFTPREPGTDGAAPKVSTRGDIRSVRANSWCRGIVHTFRTLMPMSVHVRAAIISRGIRETTEADGLPTRPDGRDIPDSAPTR